MLKIKVIFTRATNAPEKLANSPSFKSFCVEEHYIRVNVVGVATLHKIFTRLLRNAILDVTVAQYAKEKIR